MDFSSLADPTFTFAYHMYGSNQGEVKLQFSLDQTNWFDLGWQKKW